MRAIAAACADKFGDGAVWERLIQNIVSGANVQRDMGEIERSDRTILSLALAPLPDGATLVTFADVTDRFRIEGVLRERAEALEAADRLKSDFIKHVSYELRTPLNTILGFAEHLSSEVPGPLNERQSEYMQAIVSALEHAEEPGQRHSRPGADRIRRAAAGTGTRRPLTRCSTDVAAHARDWAAKVGLSLEVDCPEDAGPFLADARRIRQVVFNLLSNAFKFTPKGGVIVLGGRIEGEDVQISVRDNGPGIAPDVRANVFERFSAKSNAGQRGGAGLGLALVNRFVELHDGWVEIESERRHAGALPPAAPHRRSPPPTSAKSGRSRNFLIQLRCHGPRMRAMTIEDVISRAQRMSLTVLAALGRAHDEAIQLRRHL